MESTKSSNETLNESAKAVETFFNNSNALLTDMLKKEVDLITGFYNNLFGSKFGNANAWNQNSDFTNMFSNPMGMNKWFSNPFANFSATNGMQNPLLSSWEKITKQMMDFNQACLAAYTNNKENMNALSEEYKETIETRLEASKEIFNTISESLKKQLECSIENNKKAGEEISNQLNLVMKQNQKFWSDLLNNRQPV